ncbi:TIGR01244 family sulfur transferase [Rhodanobacter aciditrophus]|uniref:TIGR01244 family sulfur transferase n=1 Tax=Rhodanobacter aciditrophus TaxID=1623218 RepID=A0ABW4B4W0_9GAMM
MTITALTESYSVSPQITLQDIDMLKSQGVEVVINNRPDGETEDQPTSAQMKEAVEAAGLEYVFNPVDLKALSEKEVQAQAAQIDSGKQVFSYCRTGTRSSVLWVLANQGHLASFDELVDQVQAKGFDLGRCMPAMAPLKR